MSEFNDWFRRAVDNWRPQFSDAAGRRPLEDEDRKLERPKPFPDLGQGARGPLPQPEPSMNDFLRGHIAAAKHLRAEEVQREFHRRISQGRGR